MISTTNSNAATGWSAEKISRSFCLAVTLNRGLSPTGLQIRGRSQSARSVLT
ncbi:hypothetical protein [Phormidium sp. CCY1219]|uniref:hypothetical protein n=1 Tax=Phormidium sp. CCY1219 TaxID=2886104 RepID=UPI002D1E9E39|nr:hypothetical protein [Phormidium sp. CCY1219]MEB3826509.1 hypothetical protein [Phormidium sp. CCY1219]